MCSNPVFRRLPILWVALFVSTLFVSGWIPSSFSYSADRVALVIGNSRYSTSPLRNPGNDADSMSAALERLGFSVIERKDLNREQMEDAVLEFNRAVSKGGIAWFYFAGHGLQMKGENFLVPTDARIREEYEVRRECLQLASVLDAMEHSPSRLNVVVLDCCRRNPFQRSWSRSSGNRGLAAVSTVPEGTVIAFSTAPGQLANDGNGTKPPAAPVRESSEVSA